MSINWKKSAELNNCGVGDLKMYFERYPGSGKRIIATCDICFDDRYMKFQDYRDLCISCALKQRFEDPEERRKTGLASKQANINDPTISQRKSESLKKAHRDDPGISQRQSESLRKAHRDNPTRAKKQGEKLHNLYVNNPAMGEKMSVIGKKRYAEMDDPGLELVNHHYIYDHSDLLLNTVKITRRDHMKLHRLLQKLGYKVPHINEVI